MFDVCFAMELCYGEGGCGPLDLIKDWYLDLGQPPPPFQGRNIRTPQLACLPQP